MDKIIQNSVNVSFHESKHEIFKSFVASCGVVQISAHQHQKCSQYLVDALESDLDKLQKKDSQIIKKTKHRYRDSRKGRDHALSIKDATKKIYEIKLQECRDMTEPGWEPSVRRSYFGSKEKKED